jgi:hypothetical protein
VVLLSSEPLETWKREHTESAKRVQDARDRTVSEFKENITKAIGNLRLMLEEQQTSLSVIDEPPLIASSERFLTEPVKSSAS